MTAFDVAYILGGVLLIGFELYAVYEQNRDGGQRRQTISHKVIKWIAQRPKTRRVIVAAGLIWLLYHWVWQEF